MNTKAPKAKNTDDPIEQFAAYVELVRILRKECPWDRKQTHYSISHLTIEEAYEIYDAIQKNDMADLSGELGDILLHIVMHSVMAEETNSFTLADVIRKSNEKMVRRHPHIFSDVEANNSNDVLQNWEKIKMTEGRKSVFDGVPNNLPSLLKAERIQEKAAKVGFDWTDKEDVWKKVEEELNELKTEIESGNQERITDELGDVIFAIVNAARFENVIPENALQHTNNKFIRRFQYIEKRAAEQNLDLKTMTLEEMDKLWDEAKQTEK
jgi:XTP/dITP diphosphohydrolase